MILLIDNYDSFSYNLYQLLGGLDSEIRVARNDKIRIEEIISGNFSHIVLSPGPGKPSDSGICREIVQVLGEKIPILGVCLGHQVICEAYGGVVSYAKTLMHGKSSRISIVKESGVFQNLPKTFSVARYHSLAALESSLPECLDVTARTDDREIMAVEHREFPTFGVQFHPESILTPDGLCILDNFLNISI